MTTQTVSLPSISTNAAHERSTAQTSILTRLFTTVASLDRVGMGLLRLGLVIVPLWIGGLKFVNYEADSIVPFVANSPLTSFLYHHPAPEYKHYMNKEGELKPANREWHQSNGTYPVSYGLGLTIVSIAILIAMNLGIEDDSRCSARPLSYASAFFTRTPEAGHRSPPQRSVHRTSPSAQAGEVQRR